jgi:hypothetical protein
LELKKQMEQMQQSDLSGTVTDLEEQLADKNKVSINAAVLEWK